MRFSASTFILMSGTFFALIFSRGINDLDFVLKKLFIYFVNIKVSWYFIHWIFRKYWKRILCAIDLILILFHTINSIIIYHYIRNQKGSIISRHYLKENLETLRLAHTFFYHLPCFNLKTGFLHPNPLSLIGNGNIYAILWIKICIWFHMM